MNLCLDNPDRAAECLRSLDGIINTHTRDTTRHSNTEFFQDFLTLVLMDFHADFPLTHNCFE